MQQRAPRGLAWLSGVVGGLAGFAVADLISWLLQPAASPLTAVGTMIINLLPAPLVNWGKEFLGTADKPIFLFIVLIGVLVLCALGGQAELRRRWAGTVFYGIVAAVGLIGLTVALPGQLQAYVPTLAGLAAGYAIMHLLILKLNKSVDAARELALHQNPTRPDPTTAEPRKAVDLSGPVLVQRRSFLRIAMLVGAGSAVAAIAGRMLVDASAKIAELRSKLQLPTPTTKSPAVPAGSDFGVPELAPYITPNADFYRIDTALALPTIDPDEWQLKIVGMVQNELTFSFADILAMPMTEHMITLTCVSNPVGGDLVGNAMWLGVPLRDLLARANPLPGADMVLSKSHDGFTASSPLSALQDKERTSLLAVGMNGSPLPAEHGFPARMVVPGLYGYVSATKWVTQLKLTTYEQDQGYWTPLGWSAKGPIKIGSRIDVPAKSPVVTGQIVVAGVAWAQHTGISAVQVRIGTGDWREATLATTIGVDTWRQWRYVWNAEPGTYRVSVRAVDADGEVQTGEEAPPAPDGATGYHTVRIRVREA